MNYKTYLFNDFNILAFKVENTIEDLELQNINIQLELSKGNNERNEHNHSSIEILQIKNLKFGEIKFVFVKLNKKSLFAEGYFVGKLSFMIQELDAKGNASGEAYGDSFSLDKKITIELKHYLDKQLNSEQFNSLWESKLNDENTFKNEMKYKLPFNSTFKAGNEICKIIGLPSFNLDTMTADVTMFELDFLNSFLFYHVRNYLI